MRKIANIKKGAKTIGACDKMRMVTSYESLVRLFFSPQGREFCEKHNYPSIDQFREIREEVFPYNVYIDKGDIDLTNTHKIALIGDTHATINAQGIEDVHTIILMHGATAKVKASNYAVIHIVNISGGEVAIDTDKTAKIL